MILWFCIKLWTRWLGGGYWQWWCLIHCTAWPWGWRHVIRGGNHTNITLIATGAPPDRRGWLLHMASARESHSSPWQRPRKVWAGWWPAATEGLLQCGDREQKDGAPRALWTVANQPGQGVVICEELGFADWVWKKSSLPAKAVESLQTKNQQLGEAAAAVDTAELRDLGQIATETSDAIHRMETALTDVRSGGLTRPCRPSEGSLPTTWWSSPNLIITSPWRGKSWTLGTLMSSAGVGFLSTCGTFK